MSRLSAADIYRTARRAGFGRVQAVQATAIALAESGGRTDAVGDTRLENGTWGPSVGLMQVRTLKRETGKGTDRDINRLSDPAQNLAAAYDISHGGTDWTPWSTFKNGSWMKFLPTAQKAATDAGDTTAPDGTPTVTVQPAGLLPSLDDVGGLVTRGLFVVLGLALAGAGVAKALR